MSIGVTRFELFGSYVLGHRRMSGGYSKIQPLHQVLDSVAKRIVAAAQIISRSSNAVTLARRGEVCFPPFDELAIE